MNRQRDTRTTVTIGSLVKRIRRKLAGEGTHGQELRKVRGQGPSQARLDLGDFYVVDVASGWVLEKDVDLEELGRRIEVLKPTEHLAD